MEGKRKAEPAPSASKARRVATPVRSPQTSSLSFSLKLTAPASEPHKAKRTFDAIEAENQRRQIYGGQALTETAKLLQPLCKITPWTLESLRRAMEHDFKPQRSLAQTISDAEEPFVHPQLLRQGDYFVDQKFLILVKSDAPTNMEIEMVHLPEGHKTSGIISWQQIDNTRRFQLSFVLENCALEGVLRDDRCKMKFGDEVRELQLVRSRVHAIPASVHKDAETKLDAAWDVFGGLLQEVQGHQELQVERSQFKAWRNDLLGLQTRREELKQEYLIMFVGSSGAGKSRLINVLLGDAPVLPSAGEGSAVTAATVELRYRVQSTGLFPCSYYVDFQLYTRDEFLAQRDQFTQDFLEYWGLIAQRLKELAQKKQEEQRRQKALRKAKQAEEENFDEEEEEEEVDEDTEMDFDNIPPTRPPNDDDAARARHAYDWFEAVFGAQAMTGWPSADAFKQAFNKMPLKLKAERRHCAENQGNLLRLLKVWLTHDSSLVAEGQYWPLVAKAKVSGPWSILAPNLVFVDLPGTGDANAVRNEIAQKEFKRADFVCVCARVDRAITDKASLQWLDKSLRDMPSENVAYVVTKCDDVSADEIRRDHGLRRGSNSKAAEKRNDHIKTQLSAKSVQVFTVSSRDYARCVGLEDGVPAAFLTEEATEIPKVRKHIVDSMKFRKIKVQKELLETFEWQLRTMTAQTQPLDVAQYKGPQIYAIFEELLKEFLLKLAGNAKKLGDEALSKSNQLKKAAKNGIQESQSRLGSKAYHYGVGWHGHWATHKAMIVRDGQWGGVDIPQEVSEPVVSGIDQHWDLFNLMPKKASSFRTSSQKEARQFIEMFAGRLAPWPELCEHVRQLGPLAVQGIGHRLTAVVGDLETFLLEKRAGYAEDVQAEVKKELSNHLHDAKHNYRGTGSVALCKRSVTESIPLVNLRDSAAPPQQRVADALEHFQLRMEEMQHKSGEVMRSSFQELWETAQERGAEAQQQRLVLHAVLQKDTKVFETGMKPALQALGE